MIVLHPNAEQYNALNGYFNNCYKVEFAKDGSGRWIVGIEVLNDENFTAIHNQLDALERIEYTPIIE
jgi:hypothetical protein